LISDDRFARAGRSGAMKQHGFARTLAWRVLERQPSWVELGLEANDVTRAQFPWEFQAALRFELRGSRLQLRFRLSNRDREALPFALGYHPYFALRDKAHARIDTRATRVFDNVAKQLRAFEGFDLTARELDLHLLDHGSDSCTLHYPDAGSLTLRASPEFRVWVVWTLAERDFVCVEPWTARGDALNTGEDLLTLAPDAVHESWIELDAHIAAHRT
ncbi:MAG TPA: galactose mutarotase, partial [Polyangiales bacterium]|nr:galactose mutarotase [Polyangiales bacterium]